MKKFTVFTIVLGALVVASMVSCTKKDGVYNPKKKIQRIYCSSTDTEKYMDQSWDWNDNLLGAINHYYTSGGLYWTENFSYEKNRLTRVDDYINSEYATYEYDGSKLKSINYYFKTNLEASASYAYTDGKLSKITMTMYDAKSAGERHLKASLLPFPKEVTKVVNKCLESMPVNATKEMSTYTLELTWTGKNVTKLIVTEDGNIRTVALQYDNKINVTKGFYDLYTFENFGDYYFSENNVTSMVSTSSDGDNLVLNYTYQYDSDNWPTARVQKYVVDEVDWQQIDYFEYK